MAEEAAGSTTAPTLADVLAYIEADSSLSATRRRDLRSSIKIVARVLDREAALIPALPSRLREEFAKVLPAAHRISPKTWATVRCNVLSAIELSGLAKIVRTSRHTVTPEWHALWQLLPSKRLRNGLSRFFRYASAQGITPAEVDDAVLASFKSDLDAHIVVRKPKTVHRATAHLWNLAVATVPGFPGRKVTLPDYRPKPTRIDLAPFPPPSPRSWSVTWPGAGSATCSIPRRVSDRSMQRPFVCTANTSFRPQPPPWQPGSSRPDLRLSRTFSIRPSSRRSCAIGTPWPAASRMTTRWASPRR